MTDPNLFRLRCSFIEQGRLAYLSHLEVARSLERTVRRAQLPFAVTQGFSPHMKLAFGSALPVGVGSTCEIFDVLLERYLDPARALEALQTASVPDLMITGCEYIEPSAPAASVAFPFATYEVLFDDDPGTIIIPERIEVVRKRKSKMLEVAEYLQAPPEVNGHRATFTLESKASGSLRPDLLCESMGTDAKVLTITRVAQSS